jgi:hypothetical protein
MYLPLAVHRWHVWCYIHGSIHLFTWQMISICAVQQYNLACIVTVNASLCIVYWLVRARMPLLEAFYYIQTDVTLLAEIQCTPCFLVQQAHATLPLLSLGRPLLQMFYFQSTELGRSWTWSAPWNATSCHIFLLRMYNQVANLKLTENFVCHFATTRLVDKKCIQNGRVC